MAWGIFGGIFAEVATIILSLLIYSERKNKREQTGRKVALRCQQRKDQARQKAAGKLQHGR